MSTTTTEPSNLNDWLEFIAKVHPREMELGLDRVSAVAKSMGIETPAPIVVSIAGTNGKGSTVAALEALLLSMGKRVAAYTSPHLHCFNERIRINGLAAEDHRICEAFAAIERSRAPHSLSYFEFATLAALTIFSESACDVVLLEVGLGGRLDAVNLVNADLAIITSIALDHEEWLGSDLEVIGFEKAGIARPFKPLVLASEELPHSIQRRAMELQAPVYQLGDAYQFCLESEGSADQSPHWSWSGKDKDGNSLQFSGIEPFNLHQNSVAAAIQTLLLLGLMPTLEVLGLALAELQLPGRFECTEDITTGLPVILDVAHNPAAAQLLASRLQKRPSRLGESGKIIAVLAVLDDKDIEGIVVSLQSVVDIWYIAEINDPRRLSLDDAMDRLADVCSGDSLNRGLSVEETYKRACAEASESDLILVLGSFHTVADARQLSRAF